VVDNLAITPGSGATVATDDVGGFHYQRVKLAWGPDGTGNDVDVASGKPAPVQLRDAAGASISDATGIKISTSQLASLATAPVAIAAGAQAVTLPTDVGVPIYAKSADLVSGAITTPMTATTSTQLIAAPGAGLRNYVTQITVSNAHATVGTDVAIQDGVSGTTIYTIPAAAVCVAGPSSPTRSRSRAPNGRRVRPHPPVMAGSSCLTSWYS
jgi:hypothetical protein